MARALKKRGEINDEKPRSAARPEPGPAAENASRQPAGSDHEENAEVNCQDQGEEPDSA